MKKCLKEQFHKAIQQTKSKTITKLVSVLQEEKKATQLLLMRLFGIRLATHQKNLMTQMLVILNCQHITHIAMLQLHQIALLEKWKMLAEYQFLQTTQEL